MAMRIVNVREGVGARGRRHGGAVLEMAITGVLLCMICFGAIEGGWFFYCKNMMQGAAREGCRMGIVAGGTATAVNNEILQYLQQGGLAKSAAVSGGGPYTIAAGGTTQYTIKYYDYNFTTTTQTSVTDPSAVPVGDGFVVEIDATWGVVGGAMRPMRLLNTNKIVVAATTMRKEG
ncbi:MAG: TadE/TadG family type IV pilus assembly protein [Tepidisphaeraceae bacterium]|jgi:Flp pilus assembly protein TadG